MLFDMLQIYKYDLYDIRIYNNALHYYDIAQEDNYYLDYRTIYFHYWPKIQHLLGVKIKLCVCAMIVDMILE